MSAIDAAKDDGVDLIAEWRQEIHAPKPDASPSTPEKE